MPASRNRCSPVDPKEPAHRPMRARAFGSPRRRHPVARRAACGAETHGMAVHRSRHGRARVPGFGRVLPAARIAAAWCVVLHQKPKPGDVPRFDCLGRRARVHSVWNGLSEVGSVQAACLMAIFSGAWRSAPARGRSGPAGNRSNALRWAWPKAMPPCAPGHGFPGRCHHLPSRPAPGHAEIRCAADRAGCRSAWPTRGMRGALRVIFDAWGVIAGGFVRWGQFFVTKPHLSLLTAFPSPHEGRGRTHAQGRFSAALPCPRGLGRIRRGDRSRAAHRSMCRFQPQVVVRVTCCKGAAPRPGAAVGIHTSKRPMATPAPPPGGSGPSWPERGAKIISVNEIFTQRVADFGHDPRPCRSPLAPVRSRPGFRDCGG